MTYRILVTGSRDFSDYGFIEDRFFEVVYNVKAVTSIVVVNGRCPTGADQIIHELTDDWRLIEEPHPADWDKYGRSAGPIRNEEMVELGANICLAFFKKGAKNEGTSGCVKLAKAAGIPVKEFWA